ncbi:Phosphate ABC transporter, ATP-binding protein [Mycoplasma haemocanis str. Illinois]|uniref:Phosphate ABC transporter, ATP-binding protein n=1 Tax=Mycoplasma haemocanis (strain Illinois) TaxID=1111676 RepID=H6N7U6_MYCHN|nr:phosphate ABC transporter ATP-binding protein [Mycoplasma haemocanis]AEW45718.1 Phosphate ABC transporter, ATP-binding protein [Mycoplasma haemocanis str. Illinois]
MFGFFSKKKQLDIQAPSDENPYVIEVKDLSIFSKRDKRCILKDVNIRIPSCSVVAIIGPSGSGKSSLLRAINKSNMESGDFDCKGSIYYGNMDILDKDYPPEYLRTQIGTVLQKPVMFPMSIRENILFALKMHGVLAHELLEEILESSLKEAYLWDEVKDRLNVRPENVLSLGQQQRLCIARAIALQPKVLLMDEPTSALDLKSSNKIEELILRISKTNHSTIILVSHSLSQVRRVSDYTIFIKDGKVMEHGNTRDIFTKPAKKETRDFISGIY